MLLRLFSKPVKPPLEALPVLETSSLQDAVIRVRIEGFTDDALFNLQSAFERTLEREALKSSPDVLLNLQGQRDGAKRLIQALKAR